MSRRRKLVTAAVLTLLALLYAGSAALGAGSGTGDAGTRPGGLVGWLGHLTPQPPEVPASRLAAPCLSGTVLRVQGQCALSVPRGNGTRRVRLTADAALTVTARPPGQRQDASTSVKTGDTVDVTVGGDGGTIGIACGDAATCTARLPEEPA